MGNSIGTAASDLEQPTASVTLLPDNLHKLSAAVDHLCANVRSYNFYQLVELLHRVQKQDPECGNQALFFSANPSLGFAASDVTSLDVIEQQYLRLETTFLGMSGAQSPLPAYLLEQLLTEGESGLRKPFLDFFNHRLITLIYQIWRKYRYFIRFRADASDDFSTQVFALVGLADGRLRGETPINWCKMLAYSGMLAGRSRSPQVVAGIIAHCFDLEQVTIRQWEVRYVRIPEDQKMRLGKNNTSLGKDSTIGKQVKDCMGKFVICIHDLSLIRFQDFLPVGKDHQPLIKLVEFTLREQMAFDLELGLKEDAAPPMQLSSSHGASLGWSTFTGHKQHHRIVRIQIRQ